MRSKAGTVDGAAVVARERREYRAYRRTGSDAKMFLCKSNIRQPPATMGKYDESQTRTIPTNRNNVQVAAGSLETLAWSIR